MLIKETPGNKFEFAEDTVNVLWLNNSDADDPLAFTEAYRTVKTRHIPSWIKSLSS